MNSQIKTPTIACHFNQHSWDGLDKEWDKAEIDPDHLERIKKRFQGGLTVLHFWRTIISEDSNNCVHTTHAVIHNGGYLHFVTVWSSDGENHDPVYLQSDSQFKLGSEVEIEQV